MPVSTILSSAPTNSTFLLRIKRSKHPTDRIMTTITLITGANQGIGLAAATRLAKEHGHHVIIGSRDANAGSQVAKSLTAEGYAASSVQLDLTSDVSIAAAYSTIEAEFGKLDVLINNAGILLDGKEAAPDSTRELLERTFATNVTGTACVTEAMLPLLRKSTHPRLIFVSSRMGSLAQATIRDTPFFAIDYKVYDASKAALNMLALNYARILEDVSARVNVVCPGLVNTKLTNNSPYGAPPYLGAQRLVELAALESGGPNATFSDRDGEIAW